MAKISLLLIMMTIGLSGHANIPDNMPQTVYDGIVSQVMTEKGFFDAIAVEKAISQWQLDQPLPDSDGLLLETGNCSNCVADDQGIDTSFNKPKNVKIKGKTNGNGEFPVTYRISWKAPAPLPPNSIYELAGYNVYVSLDGASFEVYNVTPKRKSNGKLKKKQQIKFKDKAQGNYTVQVQALYQEISNANTASSSQDVSSHHAVSTKSTSSLNVPNKTSNKSDATSVVPKNISQSTAIVYINSDWTDASLYVINKNEKRVSGLTGALKTCITDAGYLETDSLDIFTKLDCRSTNLQNSDIIQLDDLYNLRSLIINNNNAITDISPLENLAYLTLLSLEENTSINLNFTNILELQDLYLGNMSLTNLPDLSLNTNLGFIDLSDNQIASGFVTGLPTNLKGLMLNNNQILSCAGLSGIDIESIEMSGDKVETIADCALVVGLKFINVQDAPNLFANQNIDGFNNGFCGLSFDNTSIEILEGFKPIYDLSVMNSASFYKAQSLNNYDTSPAEGYMLPEFVNFTGSANMQCSNLYDAKAHWDTLSHVDFNPTAYNLTNGTTVTSQTCPQISLFDYFHKESFCKPNNNTKDLKAYKEINTNHIYLDWVDYPNQELWGLTTYEVKLFDAQDVVIYTESIPVASLNLPLVYNIANVASYQVQMCIGIKCGDEDKKDTFDDGLQVVTNINNSWDTTDSNNKKLILNFDYAPYTDGQSFEEPDYFKVEPLYSGYAAIADIPASTGVYGQWQVTIPFTDSVSDQYKITACRNDNIVCGAEVIYSVNLDSFSADLNPQAFKDDASNIKYLIWDHDIETQLNISGYRVEAFDGDETLLNKFIPVAESNKPFITYLGDINKFTVKACMSLVCSNEDFVELNGSTPQGLTWVDNLQVNWIENTNTFKFQWKYDQSTFISADGRPEKFVITPILPQNTLEKNMTIYVGENDSNGDENGIFYSNAIIRKKFIGDGFKVQACSDKLGCGSYKQIIVSEPVNVDLPTIASITVSDAGTPAMELSWTFSGPTADVDYMEIIETRPKKDDNQSLNLNWQIGYTSRYQEVKYYTENINETYKLIRKTTGEYNFSIKACHRDRENGDSCSEKRTYSDDDSDAWYNHKYTLNPPSIPVSIQFEGTTNAEGITEKATAIIWQNSNILNVDYYILRVNQENTGTSIQTKCFSYNPGTNNIDESTAKSMIKVYAADFEEFTDNSGNLEKRLTTNTICDEFVDVDLNNNILGPPTKTWQIIPCYNGKGCKYTGNIEVVDFTQTPVSANNNHVSDSIAGPGYLDPGMWWNPDAAGTGWYFYWASDINRDEESKFGDIYDLVAYWFAYRQVGDNWTPVWYYARLKATDDDSSTNGEGFFTGSIEYHTRFNGVLGTVDVGQIDLKLDQGVPDGATGLSNQYAQITITLEHGDGVQTQNNQSQNDVPYINNDGKATYIINDLAIDLSGIDIGIGNDDDHYSGVWELDSTDANKFTFITWINRGLEMAGMAMYDDMGEPIWAIAQTCGGPECEQPTADYFDHYLGETAYEKPFKIISNGFNPLSTTPIDYFVGDNKQHVGTVGRCFNNNDFNKGKIWADFNYLNDQIPGRKGALVIGTKPEITDFELNQKICNDDAALGDGTIADGKMQSIKKVVSHHYIDFRLPGTDSTQQNLNCTHSNTELCQIEFDWYTDDYFPSIEPYYSRDENIYLPLSDICSEVTDKLGQLVVKKVTCNFAQPGIFKFQLHKNRHDGSGTVAISQSDKELTVFCTEDCDTSGEFVTASEEPYNPTSSTISPTTIPQAPVNSASSKVGATKGNFSVSPNGSANYSIPILTSAGSGGLVPSVSINYNSQSSRSALGKGWSVSGYSVVSRCGQTFAQDSASTEPLILGVNFSNTDKFCVNGKRLFLATGTSYGAIGATYVSEINDYTKYTSYGDSGGSPKCFVAQYKNGSKTYYGNCVNGGNNSTAFVDAGLGITAPDSGMALMWAQSRVVDEKGNFYDNYYHSDFISGAVEFYLDKILYTSNLSLTSSSMSGEIKLNYVAPLDSQITTSVISTSPFVKSYNNNRQLESITSKYSGQTIRHYKLNYENTDAAGFDLLTSIVECPEIDSLDTECLKPTSFTWGKTLAATNIQIIQSSGADDIGLPPVLAGKQIVAGKFDANNDGFEDFYYVSSGRFVSDTNNSVVASNQIIVGLSKVDGTGFELINGPNIIDVFNHNIGIKVADINADGFPDFIYLNNIYLWKGDADNDGEYYHTVDLNGDATNIFFDAGFYSQELYDFNGDGLVDILNFKEALAVGGEATLTIYTNRYDLTADDELTIEEIDDSLRAAFNHQDSLAITIDLQIEELYTYDQVTNRIDIFKDNRVKIQSFEQITLKQVTDINGDGIPELILDVNVLLYCPTNIQQFTCNDSVHTNLKTIAFLNDNNTYTIQHLAGGSNCYACNKQIIQDRFIDVTGDGQPEFCYVELNSTVDNPTIITNWKCHSKLGDKNTISILGLDTILNVQPDEGPLNSIEFVDFQDLDGDGILDFMYSKKNASLIGVWYWAKSSWENGTIVLDAWKEIPSFFAGNPYPSSPEDQTIHWNVDINLFLDINHDGMIDQLNFEANPPTQPNQSVNPIGFVGLHFWYGDEDAASTNKEKIINISNAFGYNIDINYQPMSNPAVYTPDNNSGVVWFDPDPDNPNNRLSPVYDFNSSMSLVASYQSDMPAYYNTGQTTSTAASYEAGYNQSYQYKYFNAKLQAGGRGFLGFGTVDIYDENKEILTQTTYRQDFPFTGQVAHAETSFMANANHTNLLVEQSAFSSTPCWVDNSCTSGIPQEDICLTKDGIICTPMNRSSDAATSAGNPLSSVVTEWITETATTIGNKTSYFNYPEKVTTDKYDPTGGKIGQILVVSEFTDSYGNPTKITTFSYDGNIVNSDALTQEETLIKTVDMAYNYYLTSDYIVNRVNTMSESLVKPHDSKYRSTGYKYDEDSTYKLLTSETIDHGSKSLEKKYEDRDGFGNPRLTKINTYDQNALIKSRYTTKSYDSQGRYINSQSIEGEVQQAIASRDKFGNPTHTINTQGINTYYSYDAFGKPYYQINDLGQYSKTSFSAGGGCPTSTAYAFTVTSSGPTVTQCFDMLGRDVGTATSSFGSENIKVHKQYDTAGRLFAQSIPMTDMPSEGTPEHWQRFQYDSIGRIQSSRDAKGNTTSTSYSAQLSNSAQLITIINARGASTKTETNILGEVLSVTDHLGGITSYNYDARGNQTSIDGPLAGTVDEIKTGYDGYDQVSSITDPDLGIWTYQYNLLGELEHQIDAKGNCTVMEYDDLGRMTKRIYIAQDSSCNIASPSKESESNWGYALGLLVSETKNTGIAGDMGLLIQKDYEYDDKSRLDRITTTLGAGQDQSIPQGISSSYIENTYYDQHSRVLASDDATGGSVRYSYSGGYQYKVTDQFTQVDYQTINEIDAYGNVKKVTAGNDVITDKIFDELGRVTNISTNYSDNLNDITIQDLNYTYDPVGNLETRNDYRDLGSTFEESFTYDLLNQLITVNGTSADISLEIMNFEYDTAGRIEIFNNKTYKYTKASIHGVDSITSIDPKKDYNYDANGNQTLSDGRTLEYTAFNKVEKMYKDATTVEFEYDSNNSRYKRIDTGPVENEVTYYIGNVEIIYNDISGTIKYKRYIADAVITIPFTTNTPTVKYLHKDHLGSTQSVTNSHDPTISIEQLSYDAFGRRRDMGSSDSYLDFNPIADVTKRGFTGQEHIDQLGIINYNARLYDPELGIMLQADTIIPDGPVTQSLNRYSYVFNNPLSYTDPSGHAPQASMVPVKHTSPDGTITIIKMTPEELAKALKKQAANGSVDLQIGGVQKGVFHHNDTNDVVTLGPVGINPTPTHDPYDDYWNKTSSFDKWGPIPKLGEDVVNSSLKRWYKRKIKVKNTKNKNMNLSGTIKIWKDSSISEEDFNRALTSFEKAWNGTYTTFAGEEIVVDFSFEITNKYRKADLRIYGMEKEFSGDGLTFVSGRAELGGNKMWLIPGAKSKTSSHEFGHFLGLAHKRNSTFNIMSYNISRNTTIDDINSLIKLYR